MTITLTLKKAIPGLKWAKDYTTQKAVADLIAGVTVGLTVLPQGLAYGALAGLEPQYGLYSAFVGGVVYAIFGGCRELTIGPTALLALMTNRHTSLGLNSAPAFAILLCLLSGIVELLMACLRLGALVDLISLPVTVGFTSAMAVIIAASQLNGLLGLKGSNNSFVAALKNVIYNLDKIRYGDFILGVVSISILLLLRKLKEFKVGEHVQSHQAINMFFWVIATARNALVVFIASAVASYACDGDSCPFKLTGKVKSGLPGFAIPQFETSIAGQNGTEVHLGFSEMVQELGPSIVILPILAVLANVAISKAFGGAGINASRELFALSVSNVIGAFFSSMPVTGSFSRSAVNHASGVQTPYGGVYTSVLIIAALGLLAPFFQYIPKAALSAIIISAVIFMIEYEVVKPLWRCSRRELLPGAITFIFSLLMSVEVGLLMGVAVDVAFLVYRAARPALSITKSRTTIGIEYICIRPSQSSLYFPAIEYVRSGISKSIASHGMCPIVLDCSHLHEFDFTAARGMGALHKELQAMKVPFFLLKASRDIHLILSEATNCNFPALESVDDLDSQLQQRPDYEMFLTSLPLVRTDNDDDDCLRRVKTN